MDALALVRRHLWLASGGFSLSAADTDVQELPVGSVSSTLRFPRSCRLKCVKSRPDVIDMLRNWDFTIDTYKAVARWQAENPDADTNVTAVWWLNSNADVWTRWVTAEAALAIQAALTAGELPKG